ncbi:unnamed protein product [Diatraea saccharalis]|uniref:Right handed beta helix domain-containing protein n=1 Tax=Diatraea saccharalis TaxID=40085 RepID=A0A9N9N0D2_9NEOP|nr:unnamed protein product [Diatraea saccharalis]
MRWLKWRAALVSFLTLVASAPAQRAEPTICAEEFCRCDSFTAVICNCTSDYEVTLRPDGAYRVPSTASGIIINGCSRVNFLPDLARNLIQLRTIELTNIMDVVINERALSWSPFSRESEMHPGLRILIQNSTVNQLSSYAIQGRVNDIIITDSRIHNVRPYAFSSLTGVRNIELKNNVLYNIERYTFSKFTTINFLLKGGYVDRLPSRFLSDVEITNLFRVEGISVKHISSVTFLVRSPKRVLVESNFIENLDPDGFHVVTKGPITFRNNTVTNFSKGALLGVTVDQEVMSVKGRQELLVDNNTITNIAPSSLIYNQTTLSLRVDGLNLNITCNCELAENWRQLLKEEAGIVTCWYDLEGHYMSVATFADSRCGAFKQTFWIFVVVGLVVVLIAASLITYFVVRRENEKKKKVQIVMPDGKTYRETEFHIVVERAELLTTNL